MTCNWCIRSPLEVAEIIGSTATKTIEGVCVSNSSKEQICLLCTEVITDKDFKRKLMISRGPKKDQSFYCLNLACVTFERDCMQHDCVKTTRLRTQVSLNLELIATKDISSGEGSLLTNICAEIAQTKMHDVPLISLRLV